MLAKSVAFGDFGRNFKASSCVGHCLENCYFPVEKPFQSCQGIRARNVLRVEIVINFDEIIEAEYERAWNARDLLGRFAVYFQRHLEQADGLAMIQSSVNALAPPIRQFYCSGAKVAEHET